MHMWDTQPYTTVPVMCPAPSGQALCWVPGHSLMKDVDKTCKQKTESDVRTCLVPWSLVHLESRLNPKDIMLKVENSSAGSQGLGQVTETSLAAGRVSPPTDPPVPSITALITCGSLGTLLSARGSFGKPSSGNGKGDFNRGVGLLCQYNCVLFGSFVFFQITLHREP